MPFSLLFWILMLLWLVFDVWSNWPFSTPYRPVGSVLLFILIALLGWHDFGPPVHQ
jgi:hypothetical protein